MAELGEELSVREAEWRREEAGAEMRRKEQKHKARLRRHGNRRLSRGTVLVGVTTELGRVGESGTDGITHYMVLSNRAEEFTVWGDELTHYPQSIHSPVNVYLSPGRTVMVSDIHEGMPESHETVVRPERVRMYSGAMVWHVLERMCRGWPSHGFPALPHYWPDNFYFSDNRRSVASPLSSAQWVDIIANVVPEQLMSVVFSREGNSRTLNLPLRKRPEEILVGFIRRGGEFYPALVLSSLDYSHLIVNTIMEGGVRPVGYGEAINYDEGIPYPPEPHLMQLRLKGYHDRLLVAVHEPEEMPDYPFRQLGFNQA